MKIPLFPLDVVLFPAAVLPLHIFEQRYRDMVAECIAERKCFGVVRAVREGLSVIGCTAEIVRELEHYPDGRLDILCHGRQPFEIELLDSSRTFLQAEVDLVEHDGIAATRKSREQCAALHFEMLELLGEELSTFPSLDLDGAVSFALSNALPADLDFKQELLGLRSDKERTARLINFYHSVLPKLRTGRAASSAVRNGHVM
jgi:Lon protease-like protein